MISLSRLCALGAISFLLLCSFAALAAPEVRVPVENQQPGPREEALRQALEQVLVQLTGRDDIASQPPVAELLAEPRRFLQRYRYESGQQGLILATQFDTAALRRALADQQVPVWEAARSPVLVWLAVERGGERLLVGADETPALRVQLEEAARRRGLPLMFPLLDAEDRRQVSYTDVFGGFGERVRAASARYGTPLVLMGRAHREAGEWRVRWSLGTGGRNLSWQSNGPALEGALDAGVRELAQRLVAEQAVRPMAAGSGADLLLRVSGVDDLRAYARLTQYLAGLGGVRRMRPLLFQGEDVVVQLDLEVEAARVLRSLEGGHTLIRLPVVPPVAGAVPGVENSYRLRP